MHLCCGGKLAVYNILIGIRAIDLIGNPTNQQRLEQIEADLERMKDLFFEQVEALEERMSKK